MIAMLVAAVATAPIANEVTVYNQGFGLIKETRTLNLKQGRQTVAVEDVASMIEPSSVSVVSLTDKGSLHVLEQNYQYDLISPMAILNKSVGQKIRFVRGQGGQRETLEGTLISAPTAIVGTPDGQNQQTYNGMVIRTDDGRIVLNPTGEIEVSSVPPGLISKPTLLWDLEADKAGENRVELSYLTRGISWNSDYVFTLDVASRGALQGWVTIDNQSGATFENAKLKLLAGDVQRAQEVMLKAARGGAGGFAGAARDQNFQEETLFEYHLYTLQRPATVRNRETKQISLLEAASVPFTKRLILDATRQFGRYYPGEGEIGTGNIKPQVRVEFENKKENGLGIPLPKGRVKVYQRDQSGSVQLLGEDNIDHTPRDEKLSLVVGRSFDVVGERKRTNFRRINDRTVQETFEIEVRNRKEVPERVFVVERSWGDWRVLEKSQEFTKLDSNTLQFTVDLKANETKKVIYTIESRW
ncbi:MAG: DUF4139 domain-containing protein [Fimbriimonas sp.]